MHHLPTELLQLIFTLAHEDLNAPPLNFYATCRLWNDIVLTMPVLWSTISVIATRKTSTPPVSVVSHWLKLSGSHPLRLALVVKENRSVSIKDGPGTRGIIELFVQNMARWREIELDYSDAGRPPRNMQLVANGAPLLERIELHPSSLLPSIGDTNGEIPWLDVAASSSRLRAFSTRQGLISRSLFQALNWAGLRCLRLETRLSQVSCLRVFAAASALEECHFLDVGNRLQDSVNAIPIDGTLPDVVIGHNLHTLALASQLGFERIFEGLAAPRLRVLELGTRSTHMRWDHSSFMRFLGRSNEQLVSLTFRDLIVSRMRDWEVKLVLAEVASTLTELAITSDVPGMAVGVSNHLLVALGKNNELLCPKLEVLKLHIGTFAGDGVLGRMVSARWRVSPLRRVDVIFATHGHVEDMHVLRGLFHGGLDGTVRMIGDTQGRSPSSPSIGDVD
ncbi:hypothetical protein MKEN_01027100 [Mycena kentingensis (nom. inval.)]|nr:hypothetical protein MKEN_01027100 [Mycena kentingensis (nom. inval.)]